MTSIGELLEQEPNEVTASVVDTSATSQEQPPITPTSPEGATSSNTTDLLSYEFPDSTNLVVERYHKYIQLIQTIENFAQGYSSLAAGNIKQYDSLNKSVTTSMPNFESNANGNEVSGSAKLNTPTGAATENDEVASFVNSGKDNSNDLSSVGSLPPTPTDLNTFLTVMRNKLGEGYTRSLDFQTKVQNQVLPDLKQLEQEVEKKQKEYSSYSNAEEKDLTQLRNSTSKVSQTLDLSVQEFERGNFSKNRSDYKKDPYLVKKNLLRNAALQVKAENNRIEFLANGEASLRSSESRILLELRRIFSVLTQLIDENFGGVIRSFQILDDVLERVPDDLEWSHFVAKNKQFLVTASVDEDAINQALSNMSITSSPTTTTASTAKKNAYIQSAVINNPYKRSMNNVTFRNNDHLSTKPKLEGLLLRKESKIAGLNSKYNSYYFVVTPSGYFYGFPSKSIDSFQPNLVLYLPDCETKIKNDSSKGEFTFVLRGKNWLVLFQNLKRNLFSKQVLHKTLIHGGR